MFFVILTIEKNSYGKWLEQTKVLGHIYTILIIPVTWVVFAITDIRQLAAYIGNMFGIHRATAMVGSQQFIRYLEEYCVLLIFCILFVTPLPRMLYHKWKDKWFTAVVLLGVFWFSVHEIIVGSNNPFLYFRF